jgi:flavin reductase (DIM6/NTAB) family NADH-FMN oxidoreductase RutF
MISCITPRPIAWVSTVSPHGVTNLAPFSFFNGLGANPPAVMFSPVNRRDGSRKDTVLNVEATRQFVVNIVSAAVADRMNCTSAEYPYEVSEFERCGLTPVASVKVRPPRVAESLVQMECVLHEIVRVGEGPLAANVIIGRIVLLHAADSVLNEAGEIDPDRLDTIGRMGGNLYGRTRDRFAMDRPEVK